MKVKTSITLSDTVLAGEVQVLFGSLASSFPHVKEAIHRHGLEVAVKGPKELADQIKNETGMWARVIETAGIKAD